MSRGMLRSYRLLCLALLAAVSFSCTLEQDRRNETGSEGGTGSRIAAPGDFEMAGMVKADEFNDQATGNEVPRKGGQIVMRFNAEPGALNYYLETGDAYTQYIASYLHNSLLRQNPETFEWEGSLAERWIEEDIVVKKDGEHLRGIVSEPQAESGLLTIKTSSETITVARQEVEEVRKGVSFTFYLRRDVRFHDGKPFSAADVKFSFETIKNEHVDAASLRTYYNDLESCEVLDDYTVRMTYSKQYWKAREYAGGLVVFPRHLYNADGLLEKDPEAFGKRFNESPYNRKPIGTGPYQFERWDTGLQVILKRNDDYWDVPRRGHLDQIIFKFISDNVAALQALKNGEVHFIERVTAEQFENETNDADFLNRFVKAAYYTESFSYFGWNTRRPPFNDAKVRLAMAYGALDRQEFIDQVLYGRGVIVTGSQYYFGPAYDHSIQPFPFDPEKAQELLLEAGWYDRDDDGIRDKDGKPFRFELLIPSGNEVYRRRAALMKENLRKLGIEMTVRELEWATFIANINDRQFDVCNLGWATSLESDPYQIWHSSQTENRGSNHVGFGNEETDRIIEQSRVTLDEEARRKLFFELHRIQHEQQPYLFLYTSPNLGVYDKRFRGVKLYKVRPGYDLAEWFLPEDGPTS